MIIGHAKRHMLWFISLLDLIYAHLLSYINELGAEACVFSRNLTWMRWLASVKVRIIAAFCRTQ